jgi:hypothetical protein
MNVDSKNSPAKATQEPKAGAEDDEDGAEDDAKARGAAGPAVGKRGSEVELVTVHAKAEL